MSKSFRLNNLKTRTAKIAEISVFVIFIETVIYLLLYNLHGCTFNFNPLKNIHFTHKKDISYFVNVKKAKTSKAETLKICRFSEFKI